MQWSSILVCFLPLLSLLLSLLSGWGAEVESQRREALPSCLVSGKYKFCDQGTCSEMEILSQAFRALIKINIRLYRSRKLNIAHVEESI